MSWSLGEILRDTPFARDEDESKRAENSNYRVFEIYLNANVFSDGSKNTGNQSKLNFKCLL